MTALMYRGRHREICFLVIFMVKYIDDEDIFLESQVFQKQIEVLYFWSKEDNHAVSQTWKNGIDGQ